MKMGRGRGKGKKQSAIAARDEAGSGEDEKLPVRRRGRPQKPMKDEEDEVEKIEEEEEDEDEEEEDDGEETKGSILSKSSKNQENIENGRKRKRALQIKESADLVTEENSIGAKANATVLIKTVGYRQNGSRRKNKPRRAAEVGVECK